jgi:hypothetical protein
MKLIICPWTTTWPIGYWEEPMKTLIP